MKFNPQIHHRRSIRLKGYDYSKAGLYFVTIDCYKMQHFFGNIIADEMHLNDLGQIAHSEWAKLPEQFTNVELDVFQIMPNHMHGIIVLTGMPVRAPLAGAPDAPVAASNNERDSNKIIINENNSQMDGDMGYLPDLAKRAGVNPAPTNTNAKPCTVGDIVGTYKSLVANECLKIYKSQNQTLGKLWHRNYHERIIRDAKSYSNISAYIINNPINWKEDKLYSTK
jgi:putative transposase